MKLRRWKNRENLRNMREKELILYKNNDKLFVDMAFLMGNFEEEYYNKEDMQALMYECIHKLLELAVSHGFYGNLWHCYLTNLLVNSENSYSLSSEMVGNIGGSINEAMLNDIVIFKEFFDYDFEKLIAVLEIKGFDLILSYTPSDEKSKVYNERIRTRICNLAEKFHNDKTAKDMKNSLTEFYHDYGVGRFGLHKAFRVVKDNSNNAVIVPILKIAHVKLDDLVGYEIPKAKLIQNTEAFILGKRANNCLLFGDAGTGKSSSIKAIANEYYDRGLRIIEIYKHQFEYLNDVIAQIKNRNYKFIIYMDDLSFEEFETEYKYLKAVIEGGLEKKPENVLIYATSNRRHIVHEKFSDREDSLHKSDTMQEKLSLASRFGCTIYFEAPEHKEFQNIVTVLAKREGISMPEEDLLAEANKWEVSHGGKSGRSARQFVDYLLGKDY